MQLSALILIVAGPGRIKTCISMNTWSFSVVLVRWVMSWRFNAPQSGFTKIGCVLTKIQSILSWWLKSIPKRDDEPPSRQLLWKRMNRQCMCWPILWQSLQKGRIVNVCADWFWKHHLTEWQRDDCAPPENLKTPINQTKKDNVPPQKTATLQSRSCLTSQGSFDQFSDDWTKKMNDKSLLSSEQWVSSLGNQWRRQSAVLYLFGT